MACLGGAVNCGECKWDDSVFSGDAGCLQELSVVMTVEVVFDSVFCNDGCPSIHFAIRVLGIVYGVMSYTYRAFCSEVRFGD